jgi:hypothetical protein
VEPSLALQVLPEAPGVSNRDPKVHLQLLQLTQGKHEAAQALLPEVQCRNDRQAQDKVLFLTKLVFLKLDVQKYNQPI